MLETEFHLLKPGVSLRLLGRWQQESSQTTGGAACLREGLPWRGVSRA